MNTRIVASPPLVWVLTLVLTVSGARYGLAAAVSDELGPTSTTAVSGELGPTSTTTVSGELGPTSTTAVSGEHGSTSSTAVSADHSPTPATAVSVEVANTTAAPVVEGRGHGMKNMMMNPYMLIPQLITLGFAPIVLANLKMMVMSALMINNMALNAAIFMTIRNIVFGPRPIVKYVNYGYGDTHHDHHQHHRPGHHHNHHHHRGDEHHVSGQSPHLEQQQHDVDDIETISRRKRAGHVVS